MKSKGLELYNLQVYKRFITYLGVHFVRHSVSASLFAIAVLRKFRIALNLIRHAFRHAPIKETYVYFL